MSAIKELLDKHEIQSRLGKSVAKYKQSQKDTGKDVASNLKALSGRLKQVKKDIPQNSIDHKRMRDLEDIILRLSNMAVNIERMGLEKGIRQ